MKRYILGLMVSVAITLTVTAFSWADMLGSGEGGWTNVWQRIDKQNYRLDVNVVGTGALYPGDGYNTCAIPSWMYFVINGKPGIQSQGYDLHGKGAWEEIKGEREETKEGTKVRIKGVIEGMDIEQNILATEDVLTIRCSVEMVSPSANLNYVRFGTDFRRRPEGLVFKAETEEGTQVSGDLCEPFETIKSLQWLEVKTPKKLIRFEFPEKAKVELTRYYDPKNPGFPIVAYMFIYPKGIKPWAPPQPGDKFGYTINVKITPLKEEATSFSVKPTASVSEAEAVSNPAKLSDARGLTNPFYRWNAELVSLPGKPEEIENDYATNYYKDTWDFNEGDTEGISKFSKGIKDIRVEDGKLKFTTGENAYFYWGSHFSNDNYKGENIGFNWPIHPTKLWYVRIKLKQSKEKSTWKISSRYGRTNDRIISKSVEINGKDWQTIEVPGGWVAGGYRYGSSRRCSLCIEPGEEENNVEIDWINVVCPSEYIYLRKRIELIDEIRSATFCLVPYTNYTFYINGEEVKSGTADGRNICVVVECGKYFHKGENVIAYKAQLLHWTGRNNKVALEGIIKYRNGEFIRIFTDNIWKGSYKEEKGWVEEKFDDSAWQNVSSQGNITLSSLPAYKSSGTGFFIDPPYLGPIDIDTPNRKSPIFREKEGINLLIKLPKKDKTDNYSLNYSLINSFTKKEEIQGNLEKYSTTDLDYIYNFSYKPKNPGVYDLIVSLKENGELLDTRIFELAVVGKIEQKEVSLDRIEEETKLKLVEEIICGNPDDPHSFIDGPKFGNSEVKEGKYRETGYGDLDWFSYRIKIENLYKPHMVVVEYLDDRKQGFEARVSEDFAPFTNITNFGDPGNRAYVKASAGVYTGPPYPLTNKVQKLKLFYYPNSSKATIDIVNLSGGTKPAISKILVYEVIDLPAVKIPFPTERLFGTQTETAHLHLHNFYAGEKGIQFQEHLFGHLHYGFYKNWYTEIENQIKYMKFCGQNLYFPCFWTYDYSYYPSKYIGHFPTPIADIWELFLKMFEENNCYLTPSIEFITVAPELSEEDRFTNTEVKNGAPTIVQVSSEGKQACYLSWGIFNPLHPKVQEGILGVVNEIASLYGNSKALKGIAIISGGLWQPIFWFDATKEDWKNILNFSYDDFTISLFEKEIGIKIPVSYKDPERFSKRYNWIMKNKKEEWIDWRCEKLYQLHMKIYKEIVEKNPELNYYLISAAGIGHSRRPLEEEWYSSKKPARELLREWGFDPFLYKNKKGLILSWMYPTNCIERFRNAEVTGVVKEFNTSSDFNKLFDNGINTGAFIHSGFIEPWLKVPQGKWLWNNSFACPSPHPGHRYFLDDFTSRLTKTTPILISFPWADCQLYTAQEDLQRRFTVPFRSIPLGEYNTLNSNGLDKNIVIRELKEKNKHYFYVVNPYWWNLKVTLELSNPTHVLDLVEDKRIETKRNTISFNLDSYGIKVFEVLSPEVNLLSAETKVSQEAEEFFKEKIESINYFLRIGHHKTIRSLGIKESYEELKNQIEEIKKFYKEENYLKTMKLLETPTMMKLLAFLKVKREADKRGKLKIEDNYRVNCGSDKEYKDSKGNIWLPDQDYQNQIRSYGYIGGSTVDRGDIEIEGTSDARIYQTERYYVKGYRFQVPNGLYTVKLHFVECFKAGKGRALFNIIIEGKEVLKNLDIFAETGKMNKSLIKTFKNISVTDGELEINFSPLEMSRINGIEVIRQNEIE